MPESDEFWDFYWEVRLHELEDLGKREAILAVSKLVRGDAERADQPVRLLELGCGEGQIIGTLVEAHNQVNSIQASCGVDYFHGSIEKCRRAYPEMLFIEGDFTDADLMGKIGQFEIVLLVNSLHEVYSKAFSPELGEVAPLDGKRRVERALESAAARLAPGGFLALFDGLEYPGNIQERVCIRFHSRQARRRFDIFAREYQPFRISFRESGNPFLVELSLRDFTRYITKSIFLGKRLWQTERLESYQYFNQDEFKAAFARLGLAIIELRTLTVNYEKWSNEVEIATPNVDFPAEHILILARRAG